MLYEVELRHENKSLTEVRRITADGLAGIAAKVAAYVSVKYADLEGEFTITRVVLIDDQDPL